MIETLKGLQEIVNFKDESLIKFYDNVQDESYPLHRHNSVEIILPVENSYIVTCNQVTYQLQQGDVLIIQPNILHKISATRGRRFICQASLLPIYSLKMYKSFCSLLPSVVMLTQTEDYTLCLKIQEQLNNIYSEYNAISQTAELSMYVSILQILLLVSRASANIIPNTCHPDIEIHTSNFVAVCDFIKNHYSEKLTLEEIARKSGYSKYHFERLFKSFTNETFYQYLNNVRINNAEQLIKEHNISITEAAYRCGFSTISSFIRMFKIHNNCTPSEYRSAHL
jgi:AraC-like DNA-binding protein